MSWALIIRTGRITKRGNKIGRTTLVQSTLEAIRHNPYLKNYYERLHHIGECFNEI